MSIIPLNVHESSLSMFHGWVKSYTACLTMLDLLYESQRSPVLPLLLYMTGPHTSYGWIIFRCVYAPYSIYIPVSWWSLISLSILSKASLKLELKLSLTYSLSFASMFSSGVAGSLVVLFLCLWGNSDLLYIMVIYSFL